VATSTSTKVTKDDLIAQLSGSLYTPLTEAELQQQAKDTVGSQYAAKRLAAQQLADQLVASEQAKLASYDLNYKNSVADQNDATKLAMQSADRLAMGRGMGRSSYNAATVSNINLKGNEALANLAAELAGNKQNVADAQALAKTQLAQSLAAYNTQESTDVAAEVSKLRDSEYAKQQDAQTRLDANMATLYKLTKKSSTTPKKTPPPTTDTGSSLQDLLNGVDGVKSGIGGFFSGLAGTVNSSPLLSGLLKGLEGLGGLK